MYSQITADFDITSFASTAAVVQGFLAFFARGAPDARIYVATFREFQPRAFWHFQEPIAARVHPLCYANSMRGFNICQKILRLENFNKVCYNL